MAITDAVPAPNGFSIHLSSLVHNCTIQSELNRKPKDDQEPFVQNHDPRLYVSVIRSMNQFSVAEEFCSVTGGWKGML